MFVPWAAPNRRHPTTALFVQVVDHKRLLLVEEEARAGAATVFQSYGCPLETVTSFKYLGSLPIAMDDYWTSVILSLEKARKSWARLLSILEMEGVDSQM